MRARATRAIAAGVAVLAALALAGCTGDASTLAQDYQKTAGKGYTSDDGSVVVLPVAKRKGATSWSATTDAGDTVASASLRGKVVVLNFWYASCPPCRAEAPDLVKLSAQFAPKGVEFLGVNVRDTAVTAREFAAKYGIDYPSVLDATDNDVIQAYSASVPPNAVPTTLVLDEKGRVAARFSGRIASATTVGDVISDVLADAS